MCVRASFAFIFIGDVRSPASAIDGIVPGNIR